MMKSDSSLRAIKAIPESLEPTMRQRAEALLREKAGSDTMSLLDRSPEAIRELLHELQVEKIELELQNEKLQRLQMELNASRAQYFDLCELSRLGVDADGTAAKESAARLRIQKELLELIATGAPLKESLNALALAIESHFGDMVCSVLLLDEAGMHLNLGAAPSLPEAYWLAVDGHAIGIAASPCGTAAFRRELVVVEDMLNDPLWLDSRDLALHLGLRACWSTPILDSKRNVLGTFAIYKRESGRPSTEHLEFIDLASKIAVVAINQEHLAGVAEKKKVEEALATKTDLLEATGILAKVGGWELDLLCSKLYWTEETYRIHEMDVCVVPSLDQAIHFYSPSAQPSILAAVQAGIDHGLPWDLELPLITAKGRHIWVRAQGFAVMENGKAVKLMGAFQDITERRESEAAKNALETQLRESQKLEAVGTLAGGIAHDFNNILAVILGNAELGRLDVLSGNQLGVEKSFEEIKKAGERALRLVQQIISFSRKQPSKLSPTKLAPIIEESVRLLRATLPARLTIQVHLAENVPCVLADATLIEQVIVNLATNSMQAMKGRPGRIDIQLDTMTLDKALVSTDSSMPAWHTMKPGPIVRMVVSDNGSGMDAATMERIFEPFFTTKEVGEGTGLGLSVVHGIVGSHQGTILVNSQLGEGTTFTIYLPIGPPEETCLPGMEGKDANVKMRQQKASLPRILLIDDDESVLRSLKFQLEHCGFQISDYSNQHEALSAFLANPSGFDLILIDYNMPGMSGIEMASEVYQIRKDMPVAICSGYIDEELRALAVEVGVHALIPKPCPLAELDAIMNRLVKTQVE